MTSTTPLDAAPRPSRWILSPSRDIFLFLATPILIIPAILGLGAAGVTSLAINKTVMALGGMGHHLPGMMRAYGDRELFRRFKMRFIVAPVLIILACVGFSVNNLHGLLLVAYIWGVWHGLMQTHGFMRIYDAKVGSFAKRTAKLDFYFCLCWFVGGVLFADTRIDYAQATILACGGPVLTPSALHTIRLVMGTILATVTTAYIANVVAVRRAGQSVSPIKLVLAVTSVVWWWYANVFIADILIGLILFEIFHDVQYLSIVWLFNRSRVDKDPEVGVFSRLLFRRSGWLIAIYVALVFAYGSLGPLSEAQFKGTPMGNLFAGLLTASALLHFYYDGFIWKMRESATRSNLGIANKGDDDAAGPRFSPGFWHAAKWAAVGIPVLLIGGLERRGVDDETERASALVALNPTLPSAHIRLGIALKDAGDFESTIGALKTAASLDPDSTEAGELLALTLLELGEIELREGEEAKARGHLQRAYGLQPQLAAALGDEGHRMLAADPAEAEWRFRAALAMKPAENVGSMCLNLALALESQGRFEEALGYAQSGAGRLKGDQRAKALVLRIQQKL